MARELQVTLLDTPCGVIERDGTGALVLSFLPQWQRSDTPALSLSLSRTRQHHSSPAVGFFFEALLPDNVDVRVRWGRDHDIDGRDALALLGIVGRDLPGAVQVWSPTSSPAERGPLHWLDPHEIERLLRDLRHDETAWHGQSIDGAFSLGGAQRKTALVHEGGRWARPNDRTPTTHILKPGVGEQLPDFAEIEHFSLRLATHASLLAAQSQLLAFGGERTAVIARFDRELRSGRVLRLHQEDVCQALGRNPAHKYAGEGAPTAKDIADLLWSNALRPRDDVLRFADYLVFQWLIANTDAHARNYSVLHTPVGVTLSPLYDVASILPYTQTPTRLAMRIGGESLADGLDASHWRREGEALRLDGDEMVARARALIDRLREALGPTGREMEATPAATGPWRRLTALLEARFERCAKRLR